MATSARGASISRVARAPELRRVNVAFLGYSVSEHATWLAVAFFALQRGGASEVGLAAAAQLLPGVLLTPFASYAGDRFRPRLALASGYAVQCAAMVATALAMAADRGILAYVFGAIVATAISLTRPVMGSLLPTVTHTPADLVAANVVAGIIEQIGIFLGPVLGGVLLATASPSAVFATSAALTGLGALAVATVRAADGDDGIRPVDGAGRTVRGELAAGFRAVHASTMLRLVLVLVVGAGLVRGVADVVYVTFADERLGAGGGTSGYLAVVYGVGGLAAAASVARLASASRISGPFLAAGALAGIALGGLAVADGYVSATVLFVLMGAGDALLVVTAAVTIQRLAPTDVLARIFGIVEGTQMGMIAAGSSLVSVLTASLSIGAAFVLMAALVALVVLGAAGLLRRTGDRIPPVDEAIVDRLLADPVFAGLPAPTIERLARGAGRSEVAAGTVVTREGEPGDRYHLITAGEIAFSIAGEHVRTLGPGGSFGEIALLRDVPRTATATATTDATLVSVDREAFLAAVTGHARAFGAASAIAETRLGRA